MATLSDIQQSVRKITGRRSQDQLSDTELNEYINNFYIYDMPERLKTLKLEKFITFTTTPNIDLYTDAVYGTDIYDVKPPVYVAGYQVGYHQSPEQFYRIWPDLRFRETPIDGNGGANYAFSASNTPFLRGTVLVSDGVENFTDNSLGLLIGSLGGTGTVNYITGAITVAFNIGVPVGTPIYLQYWPYVASRPRDIMFFNQEFTLRPVPDIAYEVRFIGLQQPTTLLNTTDTPSFTEWWQLIAYGAALKIFIDQSDMEQYSQLYPIFQEQINLAMRRALKQLSNQRVQTPYSENQSGSSANWPCYPTY